MLAELLHTSHPGLTKYQQDIMPGVEVCTFHMDEDSFDSAVSLSVRTAPRHYELLFCCTGSLVLRRQGAMTTVEARNVMLLSDCTPILSAQITAPINGVLLTINGPVAGSAETTLACLMDDLEVNTRYVLSEMDKRGGCAIFRTAPWARSLFAALDTLPDEEKGRYSFLKTVELLYLLCSENHLLQEERTLPAPDSYLSSTEAEIRAYMETHLDEKLTIEALSRQFHISPTAFKSCFRRMYGQPVHRWLQSCRMKKAAELLQTSPMTVLQIAQAVGYEGASQFNSAFKRQFGVTPRQHKKMMV